jgi:hypothetical protein
MQSILHSYTLTGNVWVQIRFHKVFIGADAEVSFGAGGREASPSHLPAMQSISVVFPAPEPPIRAVSWPARASMQSHIHYTITAERES